VVVENLRATSGGEHGRRVVELVFCSLILLWVAVGDMRRHAFATDFHHASPYPDVVDFSRVPFIYPAPAAVLLAPFGLLPRLAADVLFTLLLAATVVLIMRLCGVRDARCYGAAFLWAPVYSAVQAGNLSLLLALGLAVLWRVRERPFAPAAVAALLVALKLFLWPILVWLAIRRGLRTAAGSVLLTAVITLGSWSLIHFAGFADYPSLVRTVDQVEAPISYSLVAIELKFGLGLAVASAIATAAGVALLVLAARIGREGDDRPPFALAIAAIVLCSPVVWLHYYALFLVPLALLRPRFGPLWLAPLLLWPCPMMSTTTWWPLLPLLLFGGTTALVMRDRGELDLPSGLSRPVSART
jgi:Glycosyltransferase family 87